VCFNLLRNGRAKELVDRELRLFAEQQSIISERKTRVTDGALAMSRARDQRELAALFLSECHKLIGVTHGVIYVTDKYDSNCLRFAAGFGCGSDVAQVVDIGEGLLGQCAIDRKVFIFDVGSASSGETSDPERLMIDWKIESSLGSTLPRSVIIAPILAYDDLVGVIEISSTYRLEKSDLELFQDLLPFLATGLLLKSATAAASA
jgi:two-component system chemotaxis sensor kinase CheA